MQISSWFWEFSHDFNLNRLKSYLFWFREWPLIIAKTYFSLTWKSFWITYNMLFLIIFISLFQMWKHMRLAMKPFGYLILFYSGKYTHTHLFFFWFWKTLFIAFAFEIFSESEGTSADIHDWYMNEYQSVAHFSHRSDKTDQPGLHIWKFLKVIRIAFFSSVVLEIFLLNQKKNKNEKKNIIRNSVWILKTKLI